MLMLILFINIVIIESGEYKIGLSKREKLLTNIEKSENILFLEFKTVKLNYSLEVTQNLITWADYKRCVEKGVCDVPNYPELWKKYFEMDYSDYKKFLESLYGKNYDINLLGGNYPIETSYENAFRYCNFMGMRLPTLEEYEIMQRGGREELVYSWGDQIDEKYFVGKKNIGEGKGLVKTGTKLPNNFKLYDITGNTYEYTSSCYSIDGNIIPYQKGNACKIIIKGGSRYNKNNVFFMNAIFTVLKENDANKNGFRCVKNK